jgi:hypothetical protein
MSASTMSSVIQDVRLPWESFTEAIDRFRNKPDETMTETQHRLVAEDSSPPSEVGIVTVSSITATGFTLGWTAVTGADNIYVRITNVNTDVYKTAVLAGDASSYAATELTPDTGYDFIIVAANDGGTTSTSGEISTVSSSTYVEPEVVFNTESKPKATKKVKVKKTKSKKDA